MAKQVTRAMAEEAAIALAKKAFQKKIDAATKRVNEVADKLLKKYIPAPIMACMEEYPRFFPQRSKCVSIKDEKRSGYHTCWLEGTIMNPIGLHIIEVSTADYQYAYDAYKKLNDLKVEKSQYEGKVSDALVTLRTEKRITESFPEALPFLNLSGSTALCPQYTELRRLLH